jgi:hypothetical protein
MGVMPPVVKRFSKGRYCRKISDDRKNWSRTYETIRDLCRRRSGHSSRNDIYAKIIFVGRGYAAGVERKGVTPRDLAHFMERKGKEIDQLIDRLPGSRTLSVGCLNAVLDAHRDFVKILHRRFRTRFPSFASKYLHFHRPIVPIFDREADKELRKHERELNARTNELKRLIPKDKYDPKYWKFALMFLALTEKVSESGCDASVARLDRYLWKPPVRGQGHSR